MATQRVVLDGAGNNILSLFENNMTELGKLNQLAANSDNVGVYHGPDDAVNINYPRDGTSYNRIGRAPSSYEAYHVREITFSPFNFVLITFIQILIKTIYYNKFFFPTRNILHFNFIYFSYHFIHPNDF